MATNRKATTTGGAGVLDKGVAGESIAGGTMQGTGEAFRTEQGTLTIHGALVLLNGEPFCPTADLSHWLQGKGISGAYGSGGAAVGKSPTSPP